MNLINIEFAQFAEHITAIQKPNAKESSSIFIFK